MALRDILTFPQVTALLKLVIEGFTEKTHLTPFFTVAESIIVPPAAVKVFLEAVNPLIVGDTLEFKDENANAFPKVKIVVADKTNKDITNKCFLIMFITLCLSLLNIGRLSYTIIYPRIQIYFIIT